MRTFFHEFFSKTPAPGAQDPPAPDRVAALVDAAAPAVLAAGEAPGEDSFMRKVGRAAEETVRLYRSLGPGEDFTARLHERLGGAAAVPAPSLPDLRTGYREAACLLSRFDPRKLRLPGEEQPTGKALLELVRDARAVSIRSTLWELKPEIRDAALRGLAGPEAARRALLANIDQVPDGPGPERTALAYLSGWPPDLSRSSLDELLHTLRAVLWLAQVPGITRLPHPAEIHKRVDRVRLRAPLERLVQGPFYGRAEEMAVLRAYLGLPPTTRYGKLHQERGASATDSSSGLVPPVLIHGPGGIGKSTLLAKFLLDALDDAPTPFPFAYIDFERPTLSVHEPATLIAEMARQVGIQFPDHRAEFDALATECEEAAGTHRSERQEVDELYELSTTRASMGRRTSSGVHAKAAFREASLARRLAALIVRATELPPGAEQPPFVIVIDSFEEAQYRGSPVLSRMWAVWGALYQDHPRLRTVVSGRLVEHPGRTVQPLVIELGDLDPEAAVALLVSDGVTDVRLAEQLAARVGGHPLSLKLAALAVARLGEERTAVNALLDSLPRRIFRKVDQMLIQGTLYERILERIGDAGVRTLAQAGLALRTITSDLVREVLAEPCGLPVPSDVEAIRLFQQLARLDLMEPVSPDTVRHRRDLRGIMLRLADRDRRDLMRAVGQRAVAYYAAREGLQARAEEIYHRLRLNESPRSVEERWLPGVERFLAGAEEDMAGRSAAYLSGHLGGRPTDEVLAEADQEDWEENIANEVEDLLSQELNDAAAARLAERRPWTAGSRLHPLWVETLDRLGRREEARAHADEAVERAEQAGFSELQLELLLMSARLAKEAGDLAAADEDLVEAEQIATALGRESEALGALLERARLGSAGERDPEVDSMLAERLQGLPDSELARQPALARAAAAECSPGYPRVLEHTLGVVGLPENEDGVLDALAGAIGQAIAHQPELRATLRELLESAIGPQVPAVTAVGTPTATTQMLHEARQRGTLDQLAGQMLNLGDRSGELVSGVAAAMSAGAPAAGPKAPDADSTEGTAERPEQP
ncbi:AAA family ATPase [Streptomyces bambusae]|uniref:AAA family ATPase n=1 Tax=Streptomyces bambusae TaxID=1550616 RepID=A0ABS6Z4T0_9ACTN|nr:AAA family ATPase [Streptomyces bambusae]